MALELYKLDQKAHDLVIQFRDEEKVLNESHKMRVAVAYGLERFWGEQFRLTGQKAEYWRATWTALVEIMAETGITIPNDQVNRDNTPAIQTMAEQLWGFDQQQRKVSLAVLTQLCDSLVWWTQRYKKPSPGGNDNV